MQNTPYAQNLNADANLEEEGATEAGVQDIDIQKGFSEGELTKRFNKPPKKGKIAQKLLDRISEFLEEIRGRFLNEEQRGVLDVVRGDKKYYHLRADDLGNVISFLRSSRERNGVNHILLKHYGKNSQMGYVSAEEILNIGNIIRNGEVNIVSDFKREYTMRDPKDKNRILTVIVTKSQKKKQPDFVYTFYSNKKEAEENAGAVARRDTSLPSYISSADSGQSQNFSENQEKKAKYSKNFVEEAEELNRKFRELYDRYKNGDQAAYEEAVRLVAEEAERKGYATKVYHGTGADGFNVAKADSSEAQNGEGNQAHGAGLYMAVSRNTAEGYRHRADKSEYLTVGGKRPNFKSIENLDLSKVKDILVYMFENGLEDSIEGSKADSKVFAENIDSYQREYDRTKDEYSFRMIERSKDLLEWAKTELKFLQELKKYLKDNNLSEDDVKIELSGGHMLHQSHL